MTARATQAAWLLLAASFYGILRDQAVKLVQHRPPSSAEAERLFSTAGTILLPKRSSLTASNFEQLVLLKGNSRMFKAALKEDLKKGPDTVQE